MIRAIVYALRRLRRTPTFTIAATLTLAIAIGATTSVFGLVNGVLFKRFPFQDPNRVIWVQESNRGSQLPQFPVAPANYLDWRSQTHAFSALAALVSGMVTVTGGHEPERVGRDAVTPNYFSVFAMPMTGRALSADSSGPPEAVISHRYWERHFGGLPVLGHTLTIDDTVYTVVGVFPPEWPGYADLWTRLRFEGATTTDRGATSKYLDVYGRLARSATPESAERELQTIASRLADAYPKTNAGWSVTTLPVLDAQFGGVRTVLMMLLIAAACVLLIGAANLANLFFVRSLARQRDSAVRTALGATRAALVGELSVEAALVGLGAGILGIGLAVIGTNFLRGFAPAWIPRLNQIGVDAHVIAFCALISFVAVLICGVVPAWQTSSGSMTAFLKEGARSTGSARQRRLQHGLVVLQVAVSLVLLTGAGLLDEGIQRFEHVDLGFEPSGVLTAMVALPAQRYPTAAMQAAFAARAVERLAAEPGVLNVSASSGVPGVGGDVQAFTMIGSADVDPSHHQAAATAWVTPGYLGTMRMTLLRGRFVSATDDDRAVKVGVVDVRFVQRFFAGAGPLGRRIALESGDTVEIVGVVAPVKQLQFGDQAPPALYMSLAQARDPGEFADVALRTSGDPQREETTLKRVMYTLDRTVPLSYVMTLRDRMATSIDTTRFSGFLATFFAAVAFVLGTLGIYSVLANVVAQRRRDIAVRLALGASEARVMGDVVRHAVALAGTGIVLGSGAAWLLTRTLANMLLGVDAHDPTIFFGAAALFALVALAAASIPAFRAARVNPRVALAAT